MITKHEAEKMIEEQQAEIARLEAELTEEITKSIVIFKENHILKARVKELEEMVEKLLNLDKSYLSTVEIGRALKSLEDTCPSCGGSGNMDGNANFRCEDCNGKGYLKSLEGEDE